MDEVHGELLAIFHVAHFAEIVEALEKFVVPGGMEAEETKSRGAVVIAELEFQPEIIANEKNFVKDNVIADQPRRKYSKKENSRDHCVHQPAALGAMVAGGGVESAERQQADACRIAQRDKTPGGAKPCPARARSRLAEIHREDEH